MVDTEAVWVVETEAVMAEVEAVALEEEAVADTAEAVATVEVVEPVALAVV